jgi:hypothetical protein
MRENSRSNEQVKWTGQMDTIVKGSVKGSAELSVLLQYIYLRSDDVLAQSTQCLLNVNFDLEKL